MPDTFAQILHMKTYFSIVAIGCFLYSNAQLNESFSDGNFNQNPSWLGDTAFWKVNTELQLQSNCATPNQSYGLYTPTIMSGSLSWSFDIALNFNTSSANYVDVYLLATEASLSNGYFVRIGNTDDEVALYRKSGNAINKIIDGENGLLNRSSCSLQIFVTRNEFNEFSLKRKINGGALMLEGVATDNTFSTGTILGIQIKQSTASFFFKHFIDNIIIEPNTRDTVAPQVDSFWVENEHTLAFLFNEEVDSVAVHNVNNYECAGMTISYVEKDSIAFAKYYLRFSQPIPERMLMYLVIQNITDIYGNRIIDDTVPFFRYVPKQFDILIDEIMADPSPPVSLPECEWIELRNVKPFTINISGWFIEKNGSRSGPLPDYKLNPDSSVIICATGSYDTLSRFAKVIAVTNFPALTNTGDEMTLRSSDGMNIHTVAYTSDWYQNPVKQNGGWSLEMIDLNNPCEGETNWKASVDILGGTPGRVNSVDAVNSDETNPKLISAFANDSIHVQLNFSESLDSIKASLVSCYNLSFTNAGILSASVLSPKNNEVMLTLTEPLERFKVYEISTSQLTDCIGNTIVNGQKIRFGLCEKPQPNDVVINEILFNPKSGGYDYVELYNRSNKSINIKDLYIADHDSYEHVTDLAEVSFQNRLLMPGEHLVLTEGIKEILRDYFVSNPNNLIAMNQMPGLNDDNGCVLLLDANGTTIDHVKYDERQHMELLDNVEGVALERMNPDIGSSNTNNWHSASKTSGYGTPTRKNSQYFIGSENENYISVEPRVFTPDNDGRDDVLRILYRFDVPESIISIRIFDIYGKCIAMPAGALLCGQSGAIFWDGMLFNHTRILSGLYLVHAEGVQKNGKKINSKCAFSVR